ncbi:MAG: mannose-1-phosphate guanyltransferase [Planctomycetota bacterium]|nr:MAG: mannose-1-phosphate guanyltransferase [Planctomycetota bacterium]
MLHQVILAGGSGTRFWPMSRRRRPKQLLGLDGGPPLLERAATLLETLLPPERRWVVTTRPQADAVAACLPELPPGHVIVEPCGRDTAAAIGLGAAAALRHDPDATVVFMPADHVIRPASRFRATIEAAVRLLAPRPQAVVTIGIPPREPSTAFGYIERGEPLTGRELGSHRAFTVRRFREKPDRATSEAYLATGNFYWNAGIFCWRADAMLAALEQRLPETARAVRLEGEALEAAYAGLPKISVDYALLEHHPEVLVVEADFAWSDVGSWNALPELLGADEHGCTVLGAEHVGLESENVIAVADDGSVIATVGVRDLVVVRTGDATLVCARDRVQDVKKLVAELERRGRESVL